MNSVQDAAYLTAHEYPGNVPALAVRMEVNPTVLSHKLNPNNITHHLSINELMTIMVMTNDHRALHAMCMQLGYMALPLPTNTTNETATEAITETVKEFSDFLQAVTKALADNKVTKIELRTVRKELSELIAKGGQLEAVLASMESNKARSRP
jgi:hypothetical protein